MVLNLAATYAFNNRKHLANSFKLREGLIGQCAYEKSRILLTNVPKDYVQVSSGLGEAPPANIIVLPALFEGEVKAVIELATFGEFNETQQQFLDQLMESVGIVLSTIAANMSHELRTPPNSLLILSKLLADNTQGNLSDKQVEFASNIHDAGTDLLGLINDILDLTKIESGTVTLDISEMSFASLRDQVDR